jgi:hypothetical protein
MAIILKVVFYRRAFVGLLHTCRYSLRHGYETLRIKLVFIVVVTVTTKRTASNLSYLYVSEDTDVQQSITTKKTSNQRRTVLQGDHKVSVHLMITAHKTRKNILNRFSQLP